MKYLVSLILMGIMTMSSLAQEKKVELVPGIVQGIVIPKISPNPIIITNLFKNTYACNITVESQIIMAHNEQYPFKVYELDSYNENWNTQQDIYSAITAKVPGVQISNTHLNQTPTIRIRGDLNTIVIVDGVRYDASILNTLNPQDIQNIKVASNAAASNYFLNR